MPYDGGGAFMVLQVHGLGIGSTLNPSRETIETSRLFHA
jgi:hypothetical protein